MLNELKNQINCVQTEALTANKKTSQPQGVVFLKIQRQLYSPTASYIATQLYSACVE